MTDFPVTIQLAASVLDVVEWFESIDRGLTFVDSDRYTGYLAWIEEGPMGSRKGSYVPGESPVAIAFEGYVITILNRPDPDGVPVLVPVDGTELPLIHQNYEDMDWVRELAGMLIIRVEQKSDTETAVAFELQSDPEPMFQQLASDWVAVTSEYFEQRRVAQARQRARERSRADLADLATSQQKESDIMPTGLPDTPAIEQQDAEQLAATDPDDILDRYGGLIEELSGGPGPKSADLEFKVKVVLGWQEAKRRSVPQKTYCDFIPSPSYQDKTLAASTLRDWIKDKAVLQAIEKYKQDLTDQEFRGFCEGLYKRFTGGS